MVISKHVNNNVNEIMALVGIFEKSPPCRKSACQCKLMGDISIIYMTERYFKNELKHSKRFDHVTDDVMSLF